MGNKIINRNLIALGSLLSLTGMAFASTVNVDLGDEHQVIRGFGAMVHTAWQGYGLTETDAQLAFGTGDGEIGLNTLRIPVGDNSNGFNADVQAAQNAKKVAGKDFILFATPWTSPYASGGASVSASNYQNYTDHLNSFAEHMKGKGLPLYAISFQNEPDWCSKWTCMSANEIYNYTKGYADQLRKHGTKVISAESFRYDKNLYDKVLNDTSALKNWDILGAHFYASEANTADNFFAYSLADQKNIERWMTEHYTESDGSGNYWRKEMRTGDQANQNKLDTVRAMDVGYEIHRALAVGNFSQYTWWYLKRCYGFIMDKDYGNKLQIPQNEIGKVSKRGYVASQYARFIRPGAIRVGATINPEKEVYASAYKSAGEDSVIVVLVNRDYKNSKTVTVNVPNAKIESFHMYTTSEAKNAQYEGEVEVKNGSVTITMDAGNTSNKDCIVTLVGEIGDVVKVPRKPYGGIAMEIPGKIEAENFDVPGSGAANRTYKETDSDDHGAESNGGTSYREGTGVDIYAKETGYVVGYNQAGDWLEYTVNVKEAGDYTMFAWVATDNSTSGFSLSLDGEPLVDEVSLSGTSFDTYGYVQANVNFATAGEHILRLTVTGSWFDIDYFGFVKGKDATDPEAMGITPSKVLGLNVSGASYYEVFDLRGKKLGGFSAKSMAEAVQLWKNGNVKGDVRATGINIIRDRARGITTKVRVSN